MQQQDDGEFLPLADSEKKQDLTKRLKGLNNRG